MLFIAAEGQSGILRRVRGWRLHHGLPVDALDGFSVLPMPVCLDSDELYSLLGAIRDLPGELPDVICFDTLARSMIGDENSTRDMSAIVRAFDQVREEIGCQVIVVHHTGKDESRGARRAIALRHQHSGSVTLVSQAPEPKPLPDHFRVDANMKAENE